MLPGAEMCSPSLHLRSKVRHGECDEARGIREVCQAARGIDVPVPLIVHGRVLGLTLGSPIVGDPTVRWLPWGRWWAAYNSLDDMVSELSSGKYCNTVWGKAHASTALANNWYDVWSLRGDPAAGSTSGAARTAVAPDDTAQGALYHGGNVSTETKHLLHGTFGSPLGQPWALLYDRLVSYDSCSFSTSQQTMTNSAAMARYNGTGLPGGRICVTVKSSTNATAGTFTEMTYVDQAGATGKTVPTTPALGWIVSANAQSDTLGARVIAPALSGATQVWSPFMPMAAGSPGARSITSYTCSAANTGTTTMVLMRPLAWLPCDNYSTIQTTPHQFVQDVPALARIYDGACLSFLVYQLAQNVHTYWGNLAVGWS